MKIDRWTRRATLLLARAERCCFPAARPTCTTQVTAFSDWSGNDATRTYAFTRAADQQNNLELSTYECFVANELATHSFRQVDERAGALSGRDSRTGFARTW